MRRQYIDTSECSADVFELKMRGGKIPLNAMSWGMAEKKGNKWRYRGAIVILSRVFDDELESCGGEEVAAAMDQAFELFLRKGKLKEEELTEEEMEKFRKGESKLKRRFLKRRLRNGCYIDVMEMLGVEEGATMCHWVYQQVVDEVALGERYGGESVSLEGEGERAHDYARLLYHVFWNDKVWSRRKGGPRQFDRTMLSRLEGEYSLSYASPEGAVEAENVILVSPEIEKLNTLLWR